MTKRSKAPARALAVIALIGGFVVIIAIFSAAMKGGDSTSSSKGTTSGKVNKPKIKKDAPKVYVIKNGDTLTAIARDTGVPVATIERLNPAVDPLSLISGEELKLR